MESAPGNFIFLTKPRTADLGKDTGTNHQAGSNGSLTAEVNVLTASGPQQRRQGYAMRRQSDQGREARFCEGKQVRKTQTQDLPRTNGYSALKNRYRKKPEGLASRSGVAISKVWCPQAKQPPRTSSFKFKKEKRMGGRGQKVPTSSFKVSSGDLRSSKVSTVDNTVLSI